MFITEVYVEWSRSSFVNMLLFTMQSCGRDREERRGEYDMRSGASLTEGNENVLIIPMI
jgi:hypothetical protein